MRNFAGKRLQQGRPKRLRTCLLNSPYSQDVKPYSRSVALTSRKNGGEKIRRRGPTYELQFATSQGKRYSIA